MKKLFKAIGDFIYDVNDIIITLVIVLIAAAIIIWRATSIMAYPDYLSSRVQPNTNTEIDFSDVDLTPEEIDDINENPEDEGTLATDDTPSIADEVDTTPSELPDDEPVEPAEQGGAEKPEQENETPQPGEKVKIVISKASGTSTWKGVATHLRKVGLISDTDEAQAEFIKMVSSMKMDTRLQAGTFTIEKGTNYEDIIKILCRVKK